MTRIDVLILVLGVLNACSTQSVPYDHTNDGLPLRAERFFTINTDEGTCMDMDISPDGKRLVFTLLGNVFTMPSTGGKAVQLTKGLSWDRHPKWSPSGEALAYLSDGTGTENIWTMNPDGSNKRVVSYEGLNSFIAGFRWSDTGNGIEANGHIYDLNRHKRPMAKNNLHAVDSILLNLELPYSKAILSPNGEWLAHINLKVWNERTDGNNDLKLRNVKTGEERCLVCPMDQWRENWEQFAFSKDSKSLWIGYGGKIHRIDIDSGKDTIIPFTADIQVEMGACLYHTFSMEDNAAKVSYIESGHLSPDGKNYVFSALSQLYTMRLPHGKPKLLAEQASGQFEPRYSPDGSKIAYVTYEKDTIGNLWVVSVDGGQPEKLTRTSGYYQHPAWSPNGKWISIVKANEPYNIVRASKNKGQLMLFSSEGKTWKTIRDSVEIGPSINFMSGGREITFLTRNRTSYLGKLKTMDLETGKTTTLAFVDHFAKEVSLAPNGRYVIYRIGNSLYLTGISIQKESLPTLNRESKLGQIVKVNPILGGHGVQWKKDGKSFYYISNSDILEISLSETNSILGVPPNADEKFRAKKKQVVALDTLAKVVLPFKREVGLGIMALTGAKIITMDREGIIENGTVVIKEGRIIDIGGTDSVSIPTNARKVDVTGKTIIPGLIDMHAHNHPPDNFFPKEWWAFNENINFGVTTVRELNSPLNQQGYKELIASGRLKGPRLIGSLALASDQYQINMLEEARFLARTEKEKNALFLKIHDKYSRKQRQYMVMAAKEEGLNITGHNSPINLYGIYNLSMILDGFTGREHITGNGRLYDDVAQLSKIAKIWHTPTLITHSRDFPQIQYWYRRSLNYPPIKGLDYVPSRSASTGIDNKNLMEKESRGMYYARNFAELIKKGVHITAGSHGDYPGIQLHWEIWLLNQGGLSPYDALSSATIHAAEGLGLQNDLGSLEKGKIADLLILDKDPMQDIENTLTIQATIKNGVIYKPEQGLLENTEKDFE